MARGLRNNNPGNLRLSKDKWQGLRPGADRQGVLPVYGDEMGLSRHAHYPEELPQETWYENRLTDHLPVCSFKREQHFGLYRSVCNDLQVPTTYEPDVDDKHTMCRLAAAMSRVENGVPAVLSDIEQGWDLI